MNQFVGLAGIPLIRELVKISAIQSGIGKVLASLGYGVLLNGALAVAAGNDWKVAVAIGIVAGAGSNLYNDYRDSITQQ